MLEKMKEMIGDQLNVDVEQVTEATSFKDDLGADSLDLFELVMAMEEEFGVEIPSEELETLTREVLDQLSGVERIESSVILSRVKDVKGLRL